ncbi:hypothetical protein ABZS86_14140 [Streptomyces sp. NPDC005355]|uniref:hypothetical protein n=1 Tax=unclassified Streptomyces TaxID=2593676 RepID=UPI0033A8DBE1
MVNVVIGSASSLAALMFYTGAIYSSAYYKYSRLQTFAVGFSFSELVLRSLRLLALPVPTTLALTVLLLRIPDILAFAGVPGRVIRGVRRLGGRVARRHLAVVAAGAVLLSLWRFLSSRTAGWRPCWWRAVCCWGRPARRSAPAPAAGRGSEAAGFRSRSRGSS